MMRKKLMGIAAVLVLATGIARAEAVAMAISPDYLAQVAPLAILLIQQQFPDAPVKVDPAADKAVGYHVEQKLGIVAMPDKNFTAKSIDDAGDKEVPVGVIATLSLSVEDKGTVISGERLAVADLNGMAKLPLFFLAAKANGADRVLQVYSKDGKPLVSIPLKKQASDAATPLNVKLTNIKFDEKKLDAVLSLGGAYEGTLNLGGLQL
jgi:hypothetical protein